MNLTMADSQCAWTVVNTNTWITLVSPTNGLGNTAVGFTFLANPNSSEGQAGFKWLIKVTVSQAAAPCNYSLSSSNGMHTSSVETNQVAVTANGGCSWSVANTNSWVTILAGSTGIGSGSVSYRVDTNSGSVLGPVFWPSLESTIR